MGVPLVRLAHRCAPDAGAKDAEAGVDGGGLFEMGVERSRQGAADGDLVAEASGDDEPRGSDEVLQEVRGVGAELEVFVVEVPGEVSGEREQGTGKTLLLRSEGGRAGGRALTICRG